MNDSKKQKKMHSCHCGKSFPELLELQIHQKIKHKDANPSESRSTANFNDTDSSSESEKASFVKNSQEQRQVSLNREQQKGSSMLQEEPEENPTLAIQPTIDYVEQIDEDKKFFICGCNRRIYENKSELKRHINKQHLGFPPDGSLFGVSKRLVWNHFRPAIDPLPFYEAKHEAMMKDAFKFICGCGSKFSCFPALDYHVSKRHQGQQPEGTIGGRKTGPVPIQNFKHATLSDSQLELSTSVRSEQAKLICVACDRECKQNSWRCRSCPEWRVCGDCDIGNSSKDKHVNKGHILYLI